MENKTLKIGKATLKLPDPIPEDGNNELVNSIHRLTREVASIKSKTIEVKSNDSVITAISIKLDSVVQAIKNRPSYSFDVKRNTDGYIDKIIVSPINSNS